jgi:centrosomal protein CEP41
MTVEKVRVVGAKEIAKRRDETFYRISKVQLAQLYDEHETDEEMFHSPGAPSTGGPRIITYEEEAMPTWERPYLLLDVRDPVDFSRGHLLQARSYPYTMMRRDQIHPEIYSFKNKEGRLIIMYCDDERISVDAAHLLVQRGCDNVFVLTGGLKEFSAHFLHFCEGDVPTSPVKIPPKARASSRTGNKAWSCRILTSY